MNNPESDGSPTRISDPHLYIYSASCAAAVASGYYIHPVIARVGEEFGVAGALLGLVPALNQIGLALGILLLLPLGDRLNNRNLVTVCATGQFIALLAMGLIGDFTLFLIASFILGFLTITPYLIPPYVTRRVRAQRLGYVTGIITAGITAGILGARTGGGLMGYYFGWQSSYILGATLLLILVIALRRIMPPEDPIPKTTPRQSYFGLLGSLWPILRDTPFLVRASLIQAFGFGAFIALWIGIGLHLVTPEMGYDVDTVGLLGLVGVVNIWTSPLAGKWIDRIGPLAARRWFASAKLLGAISLLFAGYSLGWMIAALLLFSLGGASIDVANRTRLFQLAPEIRTRLMTIYIVIMFIGGGLASWLGAVAWEAGGWPAVAWSTIAMCAMVFLLTLGGEKHPVR